MTELETAARNALERTPGFQFAVAVDTVVYFEQTAEAVQRRCAFAESAGWSVGIAKREDDKEEAVNDQQQELLPVEPEAETAEVDETTPLDAEEHAYAMALDAEIEDDAPLTDAQLHLLRAIDGGDEAACYVEISTPNHAKLVWNYLIRRAGKIEPERKVPSFVLTDRGIRALMRADMAVEAAAPDNNAADDTEAPSPHPAQDPANVARTLSDNERALLRKIWKGQAIGPLNSDAQKSLEDKALIIYVPIAKGGSGHFTTLDFGHAVAEYLWPPVAAQEAEAPGGDVPDDRREPHVEVKHDTHALKLEAMRAIVKLTPKMLEAMQYHADRPVLRTFAMAAGTHKALAGRGLVEDDGYNFKPTALGQAVLALLRRDEARARAELAEARAGAAERALNTEAQRRQLAELASAKLEDKHDKASLLIAGQKKEIARMTAENGRANDRIAALEQLAQGTLDGKATADRLADTEAALEMERQRADAAQALAEKYKAEAESLEAENAKLKRAFSAPFDVVPVADADGATVLNQLAAKGHTVISYGYDAAGALRTVVAHKHIERVGGLFHEAARVPAAHPAGFPLPAARNALGLAGHTSPVEKEGAWRCAGTDRSKATSRPFASCGARASGTPALPAKCRKASRFRRPAARSVST